MPTIFVGRRARRSSEVPRTTTSCMLFGGPGVRGGPAPRPPVARGPPAPRAAPPSPAPPPRLTPQSAKLVVIAGNDTGRDFPLDSSRPLTVGRAIDNDVVLTDIAVSRKHL